jgi:hypothetical protein
MKKIGLLCLALVLAMGALGVGYALWWDELMVQGNVDTGVLCWEWSRTPLTTDKGPPPTFINPDMNILPGFEGDWFYAPGMKDVGYTYAVKDDDKHITFNLVNVYPCYFDMFSIYYQNCGTVPLHFEYITFYSGPEATPWDSVTLNWIAEEYAPFGLDLDNDGKDDIEFRWGNHIGSQLHPGEESGEVSFWIHILQECPQGEQLSFHATLRAVQYNESIHPIPTPTTPPG